MIPKQNSDVAQNSNKQSEWFIAITMPINIDDLSFGEIVFDLESSNQQLDDTN
ncbi:MAG: hypothetical protein U0U67_14675 [Chitinophagales bacterium]